MNVVVLLMRRRMPLISFTDADFKAIDSTQDNPMVITIEIENFAMMKTPVDQESYVDILIGRLSRSYNIPKLGSSRMMTKLSVSWVNE